MTDFLEIDYGGFEKRIAAQRASEFQDFFKMDNDLYDPFDDKDSAQRVYVKTKMYKHLYSSNCPQTLEEAKYLASRYAQEFKSKGEAMV